MIKTLSHYEITSELGKGGMGEVYSAKDLKLGRDVAIKVLAEEFARDADRIARFQREAKLLASLNHHNIAAIYGLEESGGTNFLVLELVEGETLADRLKHGPIPVEESLKLALQIAEALEAAHEKGVIHRDLKPANIKITPEGKVKVLDFGLAKAFAGEQQQAALSNSPTLSVAATQQGIILGTAAYMSPEQAKGKSVDRQADIWAFGAVLFEMLTGKPAFPGDEISEILASVIKGDANLDLLPANIHPRVRELLTRCLQKEQKRRYSGIGDVQYEIGQVLSDRAGVFVQQSAVAKPRKRLRLGIPWVAAVFILGLVIAGAAVWRLKPAPPPEPRLITRFHLEADGILPNSGIAISRNGSRLVYAAVKDGARQLFIRARDQMTPVPIRNTKDALNPFFSPDGNWVGFFTGSELRKVSLSGGVSQPICKAGNRYGATWGPDDSIVFASSDSPGLMWVPASGGEPQSLTKSEKEGVHRWPEFLPDGKSVLFTIMTGPANWQLAVLSLETKTHHILTAGTDGHFVSGHLVFAREGSLWTAPFDSKRLVLTGKAALVVEGVQVNSGGWAQYAPADDGTLAYLPLAWSGTLARLTWIDRQGKKEPIAAPDKAYQTARISPDGKGLALTVSEPGTVNSDIWTWDFDRENPTRLTSDEAGDMFPVWTPDGKRIVFFSTRDGSIGIYWIAADGAGKVERLSQSGQGGYPFSWSRDGKTLLFAARSAKYDIGAMSMEGDHAIKPLLQEKYSETSPQVSPDGRWMAYESDESGQYEIYVSPFPEVGKHKHKISTNGGEYPLWSKPDGRELFYRNKDAVIMAVAVKTDPDFKPEQPKILFSSAPPGYLDISPDGKRFLMIEAAAESAGDTAGTPAKINIVLNWTEELKQLVPVK